MVTGTASETSSSSCTRNLHVLPHKMQQQLTSSDCPCIEPPTVSADMALYLLLPRTVDISTSCSSSTSSSMNNSTRDSSHDGHRVSHRHTDDSIHRHSSSSSSHNHSSHGHNHIGSNSRTSDGRGHHHDESKHERSHYVENESSTKRGGGGSMKSSDCSLFSAAALHLALIKQFSAVLGVPRGALIIEELVPPAAAAAEAVSKNTFFSTSNRVSHKERNFPFSEGEIRQQQQESVQHMKGGHHQEQHEQHHDSRWFDENKQKAQEAEQKEGAGRHAELHDPRKPQRRKGNDEAHQQQQQQQHGGRGFDRTREEEEEGMERVEREQFSASSSRDRSGQRDSSGDRSIDISNTFDGPREVNSGSSNTWEKKPTEEKTTNHGEHKRSGSGLNGIRTRGEEKVMVQEEAQQKTEHVYDAGSVSRRNFDGRKGQQLEQTKGGWKSKNKGAEGREHQMVLLLLRLRLLLEDTFSQTNDKVAQDTKQQQRHLSSGSASALEIRVLSASTTSTPPAVRKNNEQGEADAKEAPGKSGRILTEMAFSPQGTKGRRTEQQAEERPELTAVAGEAAADAPSTRNGEIATVGWKRGRRAADFLDEIERLQGRTFWLPSAPAKPHVQILSIKDRTRNPAAGLYNRAGASAVPHPLFLPASLQHQLDSSTAALWSDLLQQQQERTTANRLEDFSFAHPSTASVEEAADAGDKPTGEEHASDSFPPRSLIYLLDPLYFDVSPWIFFLTLVCTCCVTVLFAVLLWVLCRERQRLQDKHQHLLRMHQLHLCTNRAFSSSTGTQSVNDNATTIGKSVWKTHKPSGGSTKRTQWAWSRREVTQKPTGPENCTATKLQTDVASPLPVKEARASFPFRTVRDSKNGSVCSPAEPQKTFHLSAATAALPLIAASSPCVAVEPTLMGKSTYDISPERRFVLPPTRHVLQVAAATLRPCCAAGASVAAAAETDPLPLAQADSHSGTAAESTGCCAVDDIVEHFELPSGSSSRCLDYPVSGPATATSVGQEPYECSTALHGIGAATFSHDDLEDVSDGQDAEATAMAAAVAAATAAMNRHCSVEGQWHRKSTEDEISSWQTPSSSSSRGRQSAFANNFRLRCSTGSYTRFDARESTESLTGVCALEQQGDEKFSNREES